MRALLLISGTLALTGCRQNCDQYFYDWNEVEIGVGVTEFISVPTGQQVSPENQDGERFFYVALSLFGMAGEGLEVTLEAFVEERRYAEASFSGLSAECSGEWGSRRISGLKLPIDLTALPPSIPVTYPEEDTGLVETHTGHTGDTGYREWYPPHADMRIVATVIEPSGRVSVGTTQWFVYR